MNYNTIGITGLDLLFLDDVNRTKFYEKISKMLSKDVESIKKELRYTSDTLTSMFNSGILVIDEDTEEYRQIQEDVNYLKKELGLSITKEPEKEEEQEFIFGDATSEFVDAEEDIFADLFESLEENGLIEGTEITSDVLESEIFGVLVEAVGKKQVFELYNLLQSIQEEFIYLPIKYRVQEDDLSEDDLLCRKFVCKIAAKLMEIDDILSTIRRYQNNISNSIGVPVNYRYDRPMYLKTLIRKVNSDMSSRRLASKSTRMFNILLNEKIDEVPEVPLEIKQHLENDITSVLGSKGLEYVNDRTIRQNLEYYYEILIAARQSIAEQIFSSAFEYEEKIDRIGIKLAEEYNIFTILPYQTSILIRGSQMLPDVDRSVSKRTLSSLETKNITILRNALLSNINYRSKR